VAEDKVERQFKSIIDGVGDKLGAEGFSKRGNAWRRLSDANVAIVEAQRSQSSTSEAIRFTFNVGVISQSLLEDWEPEAKKAGANRAHLRQRIGSFLDAPSDLWWTVTAESEVAYILAEVAPLLDRALPFLARHVTDLGLIALWEEGQSPGLTDFQRHRYLEILKRSVVS